MPTSLLQDWRLLRDDVIPRLRRVGSRCARVWVIGEPSDAVALTVAFADAGGEVPEDFWSFTHELPRRSSTISFGAGDVRALPTSSRAAWFHRSRSRWVPKSAIAERVVLGRPREPVDLIAVRSSVAGEVGAVDRLREGGHVLLADRVDDSGSGRPAPALEVARGARLRPVGRKGRLFQKVTTGPGQGHQGRGSTQAGRVLGEVLGPENEPVTLAGLQRQEELVLGHLELAQALARRYARRGQSVEDLEQVSRLALLSAARRFDSTRGTAFAAYATASILGELKRYFRDKTWAMRVPRSLQELHLAAKEARDELGQALGTSPTVAQVAAHLGVSEEEVLEAMEAGSIYQVEPLEAAGPDDERGREVPVVDPAFDVALDRERLRTALPRLDHRERVILKGLYFDGQTQQELAGELGISQMQISRLHARAAVKLRR
jgi:RNA polymerase sigma-B factor